jgi:hypothetical protein
MMMIPALTSFKLHHILIHNFSEMKSRWSAIAGCVLISIAVWKFTDRRQNSPLGVVSDLDSNPNPASARALKPSPKSSKLDKSEKLIRVNQLVGAQTLDRLRKARRSPLRPKFELLTEDGVVSTPVVQKLDLKPDEVRFIEEVTHDMLNEAAAIVASNIELDTSRTKLDDGLVYFAVKPFDFNAQFDRYAEKLADEFGREKAGEILVALPAETYFSDMGRLEAQFKVQQDVNPNVPEAGCRVEISGFDPETGKRVYRSNTFSSMIGRLYPGVFSLEMQTLGK